MRRFVAVAAAGLLGSLMGADETRGQGRAPCPAAQRAAPARADPDEASVQTCRYLRIKNDTQEKVTVYLQYRTWTNRNEYKWYPGDPATSDKVLVFEVEPGAETDLYHDNWRINASRARLWAVGSDDSEWLDYKAQALWLVDKDADGQRTYRGAKMETFTFSLAP